MFSMIYRELFFIICLSIAHLFDVILQVKFLKNEKIIIIIVREFVTLGYKICKGFANILYF